MASTIAPGLLPEVCSESEATIALRRHFHAHPELSFEEVATAAHVVSTLRSYGISEITERVGRTGVVAVIRGGAPGRCIALRADMDALPIVETSTVAYASINRGVMHACGHDGHMAALLTAAKVLHDSRSTLAGVVKLVFQPAEEGHGGAREMIADGALTAAVGGVEVDEIYGLHLWSYDPVGTVCVKSGPLMAASDRFELTVKGRGGHGAAPAGTVDAIVEAAHLITALQTIVSRNVDPTASAVLSCGTIKGGHGYNIIADEVTITGTVRTFTSEMQSMIKARMADMCKGVATTYGGEIDLVYKHGYPCTDNTYPACTAHVAAAAEAVLGTLEGGRNRIQCTCGAEDFSYFLHAKPGCFFFVGAALPGEQRPHHKSVFDFDEQALDIAASIFVRLVRNRLRVDAPPAV